MAIEARSVTSVTDVTNYYIPPIRVRAHIERYRKTVTSVSSVTGLLTDGLGQ